MSKTKKRKLKDEIGRRILENKMLQYKLETKEKETKQWHDRFTKATKEVETPEGLGRYEIYGNFMFLYGSNPDENTIREAKEHLIKELARKMIEQEIAQVVLHEPDGPFCSMSISAKLFVIPWEEMREGQKKITFYRQ